MNDSKEQLDCDVQGCSVADPVAGELRTELTRLDLPRSRVRTLVWQGDTLVDWVGGGTVYALDGTIQQVCVSYAFRFDACVATPDGRFAVIYERLGTKGVVLECGKIVANLYRRWERLLESRAGP